MRSELERRARRAIADRAFPGCVLGVIERSEQLIVPAGHLTYEQIEPVREDTIYDLASVTKSIPVAALAALAIDRGAFGLDTPVQTYLPELADGEGVTVEDLLRYRISGTPLAPLRDRSADDITAAVLGAELRREPAGRYTNTPAFLLGLVLERALRAPLSALAGRELFEPLSMRETSFCRADAARTAPTEIDGRGEVRGIVHDESARVFAREGRAVGHAGLFSTVLDLLTFCEALLRGELSAVRDAALQGLGWSVHEPSFMGTRSHGGMVGKTGFTGTSVVVDFEQSRVLVVLSNRCYPTRPADAVSATSAINRFRAELAELVFT